MEAAVLTDRFPRTQVLASKDMPTFQVAGEDLVAAVRFFRTGRRRDWAGMGVFAALTAVRGGDAKKISGTRGRR